MKTTRVFNRDVATFDGFTEAGMRAYLSDGRAAVNMVLHLMCSDPRFILLPDDRSGYLIVHGGMFFRLKIVTNQIYFTPSKCRGVGRMEEPGDLRKALKELDGFFLIDGRKLAAGTTNGKWPVKVVRVMVPELWRAMVKGQISKHGPTCRSKIFGQVIENYEERTY